MKNSPLLKVVLLSLFFAPSLFSQDLKQIVHGTIIDNATQESLPNVSVELLNHIPLRTTVTNDQGEFVLKDIPLGKHRLLIAHDDYEIVIVPEIQITAGKEAELNISLEKLPEELAEIVVRADKIKKTTKDNPINHMALTGIRSFTIEEVKRYPTSLEDPSRLVAKYPGVSRSNLESGIRVRGHSPLSVSWRVEGLPIASPNHIFFNESSQGYLPIFNIYLLKNSDFMHGIYPAEYGNSIGGVLDLSLRNGNSNTYEGSFKYSIFGLEGFVEGPLNKKGNISFIAGGRYSWISLLRTFIPNFFLNFPITSDLSFKVNLNLKKDKFTVFGIGGFSELTTDISRANHENSNVKTVNDIRRQKTYLLGGVSHKRYFSKKGYVYTVLGSNYNREHLYTYDSTHQINVTDSRTLSNTLNSHLHLVLNSKHQIRTGITASHYFLNFQAFNTDEGLVLRNYIGHSLLLQMHAQWLFTITPKLKINAGANFQYLALNNSYGISPRFALSWQFMASHRLSFGYGWNHQMQPWEAYFNRSQRRNDFGTMPDLDLGFSQNHHFSLAYDWAIVNNLRLKVEGYFQYLYDLPVNQMERNVSLFNITATENFLAWTHFDNTGIARSYGGELTLEKFFSNGYYGLLTATYFHVEYLDKHNQWRNTETNNHFIGNLLVGKEFKIGKEKNNRFFIDIAYLFKVGAYYTPINLQASLNENRQVLDWDQAYSQRFPNFHNLDIRLGFIFNQKKKAISHRLLIEAENVLNQKVAFRHIYNPYIQSVVNHKYIGILPNLSYRLNFSFKKKNQSPQKT